MLGFLGLSKLKLALIVGAAVALGAAYWHYSAVKAERDAAMQQVGVLTTAKEVQDATIDAQKQAIDQWKRQAAAFQKTLNDMSRNQAEANSTARRLNDVLSRHDLTALSLAKPGLIERRINSGTANVLGLFESATAQRDNNRDGGGTSSR